MPAALPEFVPPMLARIGEPFDSDEHLYEVKWDGIRAEALVEGGTYRLRSRTRRDLAPRYPELGVLAQLEPGCVLDGELVALLDGRPDFPTVMSREHARSAKRIAALARTTPVTYVVFDLLYRRFESLMERPLRERRAALAAVLAATPSPRLLLSQGVEGAGLAFFASVRARGLEGMVAKRLDSPYLPGKRTDAWTKIKPVHTLQCAIIGWEPSEAGDDVKSLVVAAHQGGALRCVGKVGSGLDEKTRRRLRPLLAARRRTEPLVDPGESTGLWVEPGLYCTVRYLELTRAGNLRGPVFAGLIDAP